MLTFKSTGKPAKIYYTTPDTKYMPAKMMYGENMATGYDMITETGETVTLLGDYNKGLVSLQINGKSTQDGTPTPDNPVEVESVGDKTKNLIPYPYYDTSKTINGITFTDNGDGSVTANGTATGTAYFRLAKGNNIVPGVSKKYVVSGGKSNYLRLFLDVYNNNKWVKSYSTSSSPDGSMIIDFSEIFATYENPSFDLMINIYTGGVCNSVVFKPQLELGSTATEYEPYHKYKIPVVTKGKNLFDVTTSYTNYANEDGGITFSNTDFPTINNLSISGFENNIVYSISGKYEVTNANNNSAFIVVYYTDGTTKSFWNCYGGIITGDKSGNFSVQTISNKSIDRIKLAMYTTSVRTYNIKLSNIQIEVGSSATEYEPYIPSVTTNIYLDEPLRGIESYKDYIEVRNGAVKKYQNIGTATENVTDAKPNSEYLGTMTQDGTADESGSITVQDGETVYYILSTPIVTDITNTATGQELLSINTEYGKTKTLTVTGTDMTVEQCKLNTQDS